MPLHAGTKCNYPYHARGYLLLVGRFQTPCRQSAKMDGFGCRSTLPIGGAETAVVSFRFVSGEARKVGN